MLDVRAAAALPAGWCERIGVTRGRERGAAPGGAWRFAVASATALAATLAPCPAGAVAPTPPPPELIGGSESVATTDGAAAAFFNPAALGLRYPGEAFFSWTHFSGHAEINHGVLSLGGLGVLFTRVKDRSQFYGGALAFGSPRLRLGLVQGVLKSDASSVGDDRIGMLIRPGPALSAGFAVTHLFQPKLDGEIQSRRYEAGIGLRPAARLWRGSPDLADRLTLSADLVIPDDGEWSQSRARFGAELEPLRGLLLRGAVEDHGGWHFGVTLRAPRVAIGAHSASDGAGFQDYRTGSISIHGGEDLSVFAPPSARRVTEIRVAGALADESISGFGLLGGGSSTRSVAPLRDELERARVDPLTRGVLLRIEGVSGMASLEELRPRLRAIRAAGKPIVAWLPYGAGRGDLYLASGCDRIVSTPAADFQQLGLRSERRYYRQLLQSLGLRIDRVSVGRYKSAYRNFSVDSTSDADREVIEHTLDVSQRLFVDSVTAGRHLARETLMPLLDGRRWESSEVARAGLIDSVGYREDALRLLGHLTGLGDHPRAVPLRDRTAARREWPRRSPIAVVYASGGIDLGSSGNDLLTGPFMGATTLIRSLERAFKDRQTRVVVLRVESPGGSALATDLIAHEVDRLRRESGKPLIVSMGSAAASGGYAISLPADLIYCDRFTRTGSIGVVFVKPSLEGFYRRHHVRQDSFERGPAMSMGSIGHDWTAAEQASADSAVMREYRRFVAEVARVRHLPEARVDSIAEGRVWLGDDALERGLVDRIGGLEDAIAEARRRGGIPEGEPIALIEVRRPRPGLLQRWIGGQVREALEREAGGPDFEGFERWDDGEGGP